MSYVNFKATAVTLLTIFPSFNPFFQITIKAMLWGWLYWILHTLLIISIVVAILTTETTRYSATIIVAKVYDSAWKKNHYL